MNKLIQQKWKQQLVLGYDCIAFGDGRVVIANTYCVRNPETKETKQFWFPLCDTTLEGVLKYDDDIWTETDIFWGTFCYENQQFVFGDGGMGNEGYIASLDLYGNLNWSIFFTFSNPIHKADVQEDFLYAYGDTGTVIKINLKNITEVQVSYEERDDSC